MVSATMGIRDGQPGHCVAPEPFTRVLHSWEAVFVDRINLAT